MNTTKQIVSDKLNAAGLQIHMINMRSKCAHVGIGRDIRCIKTDRLLEGRGAADVFAKSGPVDPILVRRYTA